MSLLAVHRPWVPKSTFQDNFAQIIDSVLGSAGTTLWARILDLEIPILLVLKSRTTCFPNEKRDPRISGCEAWPNTWRITFVVPSLDCTSTFTVPKMSTWRLLATVILGNCVHGLQICTCADDYSFQHRLQPGTSRWGCCHCPGVLLHLSWQYGEVHELAKSPSVYVAVTSHQCQFTYLESTKCIFRALKWRVTCPPCAASIDAGVVLSMEHTYLLVAGIS